MVTHSPGTVRGLKILVSAVRFCPWPYPLPLGFNQLDPLRSRLSSIFSFYFAKTLPVSIPDRVMCELLLVRNQPGEDALSNRLFVGS